MTEINQMMVDMRTNPLKEINGERVVMMEDYKSLIALNLLTNEQETMHIPSSDVLIYYTEDGSKIAARPSGTEPKIKFYFSVNEPLMSAAKFHETEKMLDDKIVAIIKDMGL